MESNKRIPTNREIAEDWQRLEMEFQEKAKNNLMMGVCEICKTAFKMNHFMDEFCPECVKRIAVF